MTSGCVMCEGTYNSEGCRHRSPLSTPLPNPVSHLAGAVVALCDQVVPHWVPCHTLHVVGVVLQAQLQGGGQVITLV